MTVGGVLQIIYLLVYGVIGFTISVLGQYYVWENVERVKEPMHDFFFELLPDASHDIDTFLVPNWISILMLVLALLSLYRDKMLQLICQFLFLQTTLTAARGIVIALTLFPLTAINEACDHHPSNVFDTITTMIQYGTCGDFMWSGHTANAMLAYLFTQKYKRSYWFELLQGLLLGGIIISLLIFRWHYSVDIVVAVFVTFLFFHIYGEYEYLDYWFYFKAFSNSKGRKNYEIILNN